MDNKRVLEEMMAEAEWRVREDRMDEWNSARIWAEDRWDCSTRMGMQTVVGDEWDRYDGEVKAKKKRLLSRVVSLRLTH